MSEKVDDISGITVSAKVFSEMFGVSERRVRQLGEQGVLVRASKGRYKLAESIKNYVLTLKLANDSENIQSNDNELDLEQEKAKKERINRMISELKLAKMKGEVHTSYDVEAVMTDMLSSFRSRLLNMPAKVSPILTERDTGYINDYLNKEVNNILNELKDYKAEDFYSDDFVEIESEEIEE